MSKEQEDKESTISLFNKTLSNSNKIIIERISNPLIGSYLISWCVINWKFLAYMFFSSKKFDERLIEYKSYIKSDTFLDFSFHYMLPFCISIIYIFILPWIDLQIDKITYNYIFKAKGDHESNKITDDLTRQLTRADLEFKVQDKLLGKKTKDDLIFEKEKLEEESSIKAKRIEDLQNEIISLNTQNSEMITSYQKQIEEKDKQNNQLKESLKESEKDIRDINNTSSYLAQRKNNLKKSLHNLTNRTIIKATIGIKPSFDEYLEVEKIIKDLIISNFNIQNIDVNNHGIILEINTNPEHIPIIEKIIKKYDSIGSFGFVVN